MVTASIGVAVLAEAFLHWHSNDLLKFVCYLYIAVLASTLKVNFPGMESTMSVHFLFVLLGVLELSFAETLAIGCAAALVQSVWKTRHKMEAVNATGAGIIATANPGCMLQLQAGVRLHGSGQRVMHVVEILDEAYRKVAQAVPPA